VVTFYWDQLTCKSDPNIETNPTALSKISVQNLPAILIPQIVMAIRSTLLAQINGFSSVPPVQMTFSHFNLNHLNKSKALPLTKYLLGSFGNVKI